MAGRTTVKYGSRGSDVTELQNKLNANGYKLDVDGIFGNQTQSAVKDYQQKNGLAVDGIVGNNTWKMIDLQGPPQSGYTPTAAPNGYTPTEAPTLAPMPTAPTYDTSTWDESTKGSAAGEAYEAAKNAINSYKPFEFSENEWLNSIKGSIKNYGEFSYDVNSDALYQQYADQYVRQGKLASADVMGQAAAMTGGYGNSYASSAGNQAFQSYLQQLNDRVPELYQLALDRYNMGKQDLYDQYGMLLSEYEREYGLYSDEYNKLLDALGIAKDDYYSGADMFYTEQGNKNNVLGKEFNDAMAIWEADTNNKWKQAEWDEGLNQYANDQIWRQAEWNESNNRYANDQIWREKEYDLNERQVTLQENTYNDSKTAAADNTKYYNGTNNEVNYNNGSLTAGQVKELQAALGVEADGYYGPDSQKAAGGLSAAEAYAKFVKGETKSGITDDIKNKAASFESNEALGSYLDGLVESGIITEADSDSLYAQYVDDNEKYNKNDDGSQSISYSEMVGSTNGWSVVDDGGINWFGIGIDADAIVKAPNGEQIRLDSLRAKLQDEGMSWSEAQKAIIQLQKNLGI